METNKNLIDFFKGAIFLIVLDNRRICVIKSHVKSGKMLKQGIFVFLKKVTVLFLQ